MSTHQCGLKEPSESVVDCRNHTRREAPEDTYVQVEYAHGTVQARILDASPFCGACLVFDDNPRLEAGNTISVSYGKSRIVGQVRHAQEFCDEYRVGVCWVTDVS